MIYAVCLMVGVAIGVATMCVLHTSSAESRKEEKKMMEARDRNEF